MRIFVALVFGAMLMMASSPSVADPSTTGTFSTNSVGQPTAQFTPVPQPWDVSMEIQDGAGNTLCTTSPAFPNWSLLSSQLDRAEQPYLQDVHQQRLQGLLPGFDEWQPHSHRRRGIEPVQTSTNSFLDVFFEVDLGGGNLQEAVLGFNLQPVPNPFTPPTTTVTGPGTIGWIPPGPGGNAPASFFLDPMAFEPFAINLQPGPFLTGQSPPPLTPNPNNVPEPSTLLLLGTAAAALLGWSRRFGKRA